MLAGIIRNPITYNPVRFPERAAERRDWSPSTAWSTPAGSPRTRATLWKAAPTDAPVPRGAARAQRLLPDRGRAAAPQRSGVRDAGRDRGPALQGGVPGRPAGLHHARPGGAAAGAGGPRLRAAARERRRPAAGRQPGRRASPNRATAAVVVGRARHRRRAHHGRRARVRQLQVQPRHPEPSGRRLVVQDVRAGHDHGAGLLARRHHQRHRPLQLRRRERGGRGLRRQQLRRRRRLDGHRSPRPRSPRRTAPSCGWG